MVNTFAASIVRSSGPIPRCPDGGQRPRPLRAQWLFNVLIYYTCPFNIELVVYVLVSIPIVPRRLSGVVLTFA